MQATYLFHIEAYFSSVQVFHPVMPAASFIVIASAGHDNAHRPQAVQSFFLFVTFQLVLTTVNWTSFTDLFRVLNGNL
jgi:hypothetical protein